MILGIDLGNYATKSSKGISFLSKVCLSGGFEENGENILLDGVKFYLGEGDFDTEYRKAYKSNLLPILYGAIALSTSDKSNCIVLGLPLSQYKEDKEYLTNLVLQNSKKEIEINGVIRKVIIEDVEIVPEGVSAADEDFEGIIIDIGGRTTDICLIQQEGNRRKVRKPYSIPKGILNLESDYINIINKRYGLDLLPGDAQRILREGLKIYGEPQKIDFAMEVYKTFVDGLISQVQVDYPVKTYNILLVGGGAELLYNPIKKRLPNAELINNSFWGNALGYERIGKEIWQ